MTQKSGRLVELRPQRYIHHEEAERALAHAGVSDHAHVCLLSAPDHCVVCREGRDGRAWPTGQAIVAQGTQWSLQGVDAYDERKWMYLWLTRELTTPRSCPEPLAVIREDRTLVWAPGQPGECSDPVLTEMIRALPVVVRIFVEDELRLVFTSAGHIQKGPPFALELV